MQFTKWQNALEDLGMSTEEAADKMLLPYSTIEKWEKDGVVPKQAVLFIEKESRKHDD